MVGLKKILNVEKPVSQSNYRFEHPEHEACAGAPQTCESSAMMEQPSGNDCYYPSDPALPRLSQMHNQTFLGIERQFEELHDQFRTRPSRSLSSKSRRYKHVGTKPTPSLFRNKRHIDVLQALFSPHKHRPVVPTPVTPSTVYNEDIADRNLRVPMSTGADSSPCSGVMSSRYQEDVAERNLQINGCNVNPGRNNMKLRRADRKDVGDRGNHLAPRSKSEMATHSLSYEESSSSALRAISSDQDLRDDPVLSQQQWQQQWQQAGTDGCASHRPKHRPLRSQCSVPALLPTSMDDHGEPRAQRAQRTSSREQQNSRLDVSSVKERSADLAKATGDRHHTTPSPLQLTTTPAKANAVSSSIDHSLSGKAVNRLMSANPMGSVARKNIHDLAVDTSLAAPRKAFVKVGPRPAEPKAPTPRLEAPSSIAEIVNSPVSAATSTRPSPSYNPEEIMNLFKKAYTSSQSASPHPTFESLQDAIIREINSHDAFRHVNSDSSGLLSAAPELSPDLTSDECYETQFLRRMNKSPHQSQRPVSRTKLQPKQSRKSSMRKQRRNSDSIGRELSFPALKGEENSTEAYVSKSKNKKRRHTYGHPYSASTVQSYDYATAEEDGIIENSRRTPDAPPDNDNDVDNESSTNPPRRRPRSSHGLSSKSASTVLDPTSQPPPKRPHSLNLLRPPSRPKPATKQKVATGSATEDGSQQQQQQQISGDRHEPRTADKRTISAASAPSEPRRRLVRPDNNNNNNNNNNKTQWRTSPAPAAGRKRIPLRKSSIQKDMYDSGRFRM